MRNQAMRLILFTSLLLIEQADAETSPGHALRLSFLSGRKLLDVDSNGRISAEQRQSVSDIRHQRFAISCKTLCRPHIVRRQPHQVGEVAKHSSLRRSLSNLPVDGQRVLGQFLRVLDPALAEETARQIVERVCLGAPVPDFRGPLAMRQDSLRCGSLVPGLADDEPEALRAGLCRHGVEQRAAFRKPARAQLEPP